MVLKGSFWSILIEYDGDMMFRQNMKQEQSIWLYFWFGLLGLLIGASIFFRGYLLSFLPGLLNRDEAALAYNAFSLKTTGLDEWGRTWPLALQSFGDYKLIGYPAVLVGFFQIFKVHDWTVRLPSMLAGIGIIVLSFMIGRKLFTQKLAWFFTGLVATAPVFLFYSRSAWEANLGLFYVLWACYLLFFHQQKMISVKRTLIAFALTIAAVLTYNTPLILMPLIVLVVPLFTDHQYIKRSIVVVLGILAICLSVYLFLRPVFVQKSSITVFTDPTIYAQWIDYRQTLSPQSQAILGNRYLFLSNVILKNFFLSFSPKFLVTQGGAHPWHSLPGWGHLYWSVAILAIAEFYFLLGSLLADFLRLMKKKSYWLEFRQNFKKDYIWLYLAFVSLLPAVVTVDAPHATRSLLFFWVLTLLAVRGVRRLSEFVSKQLKKQLYLDLLPLMVLLLIAFSFSQYFEQYFKNYPLQATEIFQTNFAEVVAWIEATHPDKPVAVVDPSGYQYILLAWYLKIDPGYYLANNIRQNPNGIGLRYGEKVGRYHFIVQEKDAIAEEKIILIWDTSKKHWLVKNFDL